MKQNKASKNRPQIINRNMATKTIFSAILVILGAYFLLSYDIPIQNQTPITIVEINEEGFSPREVTVKVGDTVAFTNTGTDNHWPASDPHPVHTIYSEFDPRRALLPGESWSFAFDRAGTWRFHDHYHPSNRGTVQVLNKDGSAPSTTVLDDSCVETSADFTCYENYFEQLVKERGAKEAFVDLLARYAKSDYVRSQCHPLTHVIGHATAELYPKVSDAYAKGDAFCWSGYYHGVMETIVEEIGRENITKQLDSICANIPGKENYNFDYFNCVHGLGHGLMAILDNKLFDSLTLCDSLVGQWEKSSCYGGVFMENVMVDNKNHFSEYLKPEDPLYPCNAVEEKYKNQCYLMQSSYMLKVTNWDFVKVFALCREADKGHEHTCFQSIGRDASGQSLSNIEKTKTTCELGADYNERSNCIIGAVKDFISYYHDDKEAKGLCTAVAEDIKLICTNTATAYFKLL
jgi:plastocyanin